MWLLMRQNWMFQYLNIWLLICHCNRKLSILQCVNGNSALSLRPYRRKIFEPHAISGFELQASAIHWRQFFHMGANQKNLVKVSSIALIRAGPGSIFCALSCFGYFASSLGLSKVVIIEGSSLSDSKKSSSQVNPTFLWAPSSLPESLLALPRFEPG